MGEDVSGNELFVILLRYLASSPAAYFTATGASSATTIAALGIEFVAIRKSPEAKSGAKENTNAEKLNNILLDILLSLFFNYKPSLTR